MTEKDNVTTLVRRWKYAATRIDEILFTPAGWTKVHDAYEHLQKIRTTADVLQPEREDLAAQARQEADRLEALVRQWIKIWWPID